MYNGIAAAQCNDIILAIYVVSIAMLGNLQQRWRSLGTYLNSPQAIPGLDLIAGHKIDAVIRAT